MISIAALSTDRLLSSSSSIEPLMVKPLIIGTSVSADSKSVSPGKRLALRYTDEEQIKTLATCGQSGHRLLSRIRSADFQDRTVVFGLDLFFWDSLLADVDLSLKALGLLVQKTLRLGIPLVLGDIPELIPKFQPGRNTLNLEIRHTCSRYSHCRLLPLDSLYSLMQ